MFAEEDLETALMLSLEDTHHIREDIANDSNDHEEALRRAIEESLQLADDNFMARDDLSSSITVMDRCNQYYGSPPHGTFRRFVGMLRQHSGLVVGRRFSHVKDIAKRVRSGCSINFVDQDFVGEDCSVLVIEAQTDVAAQDAEDALQARIVALLCPRNSASAPSLPPPAEVIGPRTLQPEQYRHIFVDFSNVYIGAQLSASTPRERNGHRAMDPSVRINCNRLAQILKGPQPFRSRGMQFREGGIRLVAGSSLPGSPTGLWKTWRHLGFTVKVLERSHSRAPEQSVDDFLVGQIYREIINRSGGGGGGAAPGSDTLVLASGDGNCNDGFASFAETVRAAAVRGWRVEVWAWRRCCSRVYHDMVEFFSDGRVSICYLDEVAGEILYHTGNGRAPVSAPPRVGAHAPPPVQRPYVPPRPPVPDPAAPAPAQAPAPAPANRRLRAANTHFASASHTEAGEPRATEVEGSAGSPFAYLQASWESRAPMQPPGGGEAAVPPRPPVPAPAAPAAPANRSLRAANTHFASAAHTEAVESRVREVEDSAGSPFAFLRARWESRDPMQPPGGGAAAPAPATSAIRVPPPSHGSAAAGPRSGVSGTEGGTRRGDGDDEGLDQLCIICMDAPKSHALMPCGHFCLCRTCTQEHYSSRGSHCPVCRASVSSSQQIFI